MKRLMYLLVTIIGVGLLMSNATTASAQPRFSLLVDVSGSISSNQLELTKQVSRFYIRAVTGFNHVGRIKTFSDSESVETNLTPWTKSADTLIAAINDVANTAGLTALYDAIFEAASDTGFQSGLPRRLLIFTDLGENNSSRTFEDVTQAIFTNGILPYLFVYPPNFVTVDLAQGMDSRQDLISLVEQAGGKVFYINSSSDIDAAFRYIGNLEKVPSMTPLGLVILVGLLMFTAIYWVMRRKAPVKV